MAIKASDTITLTCYKEIVSVTTYYRLQSATVPEPVKPTNNPPTGWTDTEPAYWGGTSNTLYVCEQTLYSNNTWSYSEVSKSSSYEAAKEAWNKAQEAQDSATSANDKADKNFEAEMSKGGQLIVNGAGGLGNNSNFSQFVYDGVEANNSAGSFTYPEGGKGTFISDYFIPIDTSLKYRFEFDAKTKDGLSTMRSMMVFYDVDKNDILARHTMWMADTSTELAQDLKDGDTVVYLKDLANWNVNTGTTTYRRGFIFWNYANSRGYVYPEHTYSRNVWWNLYTDANVNKEDNTITLISPWNRGTIPAGTKLSQSNSGAQYKYQGANNIVIPTSWTHYTGGYSGVDFSGKNVISQFPPATAYARVGFVWNENSAQDQIWVTNLSLKEDYWTDIDRLDIKVDNQKTEILQEATQIILEATADLVRTGDYERFTEQLQAQLAIMANEISMNFTLTSTEITSLNGEFSTEFNRLYKYIKFTGEDGITIGSGDSAITLTLDNDGIVFANNGVEFGNWDGNNFHTGNIVVDVNERAQFGNFAFVPRSDGSLQFLKVGG